MKIELSPLRQSIIDAIANGHQTSSGIAKVLGHGFKATSSALARMERAGLVRVVGTAPGPFGGIGVNVYDLADGQTPDNPKPFKIPEHDPLLAAFFGLAPVADRAITNLEG